MIHRYGRYGPHAWKRRRQLHAKQEKTSLSSLSLPIVIDQESMTISLPLFTSHTERIILVIIREEKGTIVNALPAPESEQAHILYIAEAHAQRKAAYDLQHLDEALTESEAKAYAADLWLKNEYPVTDPEIRKEVIALKRRDISARDVYVQEFTAVYSREFTAKGIAQWDSETKAILSQARTDKTFDLHRQVFLSDQERLAQAAIRVYERLRIDPRLQREELHRYIRQYDDYYQNFQIAPEGGADSYSRSNGFRPETDKSEA